MHLKRPQTRFVETKVQARGCAPAGGEQADHRRLGDCLGSVRDARAMGVPSRAAGDSPVRMKPLPKDCERMEEGMRRRWLTVGGVSAVLSMLPGLAMAAGEKATELVVVADTRMLSGWNLYFATLYNEDMWLFATWAVVLTTAMGMGLGLIMDFVMKRTGIDLTSRKIVEH